MSWLRRFLDKKVTTPDRDIAIALFVVLASASVYHALTQFSIISDSYTEYATYLLFVNLDSHWWRPITDNMLSVSLWTTYFPAQIQRVLMLPNPETVYRVSLGILSATAPPVLYIAARRYVRIVPALVMSFVLCTSFYYSGHAAYARMLVAVAWMIFLVRSLQDESPYRYLRIAVGVLGLLTAHYTVAWVAVVIFSMAGCFFLLSREWSALRRFAVAPAVLQASIILFYGVLARYARVWSYFASALNTALVRYTGLSLPAFLRRSYSPEAGTHAYTMYTVPLPGEEATGGILPLETDAVAKPPVNVGVLGWNPLKGQREDFVVGKSMVLLRTVLAIPLTVSLLRNGYRSNPIVYLYIAAVIVSALGIWIPEIAVYVGSLRIPFITLPIELLAIALWMSGNRFREIYASATLMVFAFVYH